VTAFSKIAKLLSEQKIIAVYNEQAEAGPRALGNRSILFDARNKKAKEIVNKIKKREWYRPFACSVLEEYARDYFNMYHLKNSPFMTISFPVLKNKLKIIPGVTHVDNSCRIQTVNKSIPHLYKLLNEFKKITNVPVLLNTSFNIAGEPLVESKEDAIKTFKESDIDVLWFPELGKIITKR
jgi:carbamoyltransferase